MTTSEQEVIGHILERSKVIAVVGLSDRPDRPSHDVAMYLQMQGYRIIPVNPLLEGPVLGEQPYPNLASVPEKIDIVDIFRRSDQTLLIVDEALEMGVPVIWMQSGIVNEEAAAKARAVGVQVVMDHCMKVEHRKRSKKK